jgi:hypothetical protein
LEKFNNHFHHGMEYSRTVENGNHYLVLILR